ASYSNAAYANSAMAYYTNMGLPVFLEQGQNQDKTFQRVWIGPFKEQSQANAARERIRVIPNQNPAEVIKR
ncbi:MAG: SPOR domain-containing protein, partial [Magnetococcales bacterium]|nr:SPOR domain-containing protein [Magnetococcales bacterium]